MWRDGQVGITGSCVFITENIFMHQVQTVWISWCIRCWLTLGTWEHRFYRAQIVFALLSHISDILTAISWISEPITGMFVLISIYFSWWLQIWPWNFTIFDIFLQNLLNVWHIGVCTRMPRGKHYTMWHHPAEASAGSYNNVCPNIFFRAWCFAVPN